MTATACTCGFSQLPDEGLIDHLLAVFTPDDAASPDGQVHEEGENRTCSCGAAPATVVQLDEHFMTVFAPADRIGRDGRKHEPTSVG